MCGRYAMISAPETIRARFGYPETPNFPPRYNIAPTQPIAIVRLAEGRRQFALVRWGFIPSWVRNPATVSLMFNARGETAADKPAYRAAMRRRRCLVPADGFYEWRRDGGRKRPYWIYPRGGGPIAFAGLWEVWNGPNGEEMETAAILTTRANRTLAPLHERMPVVIRPEAFDFWLDPNVDVASAAALIAPAPDDLLEAREVSGMVNRAANDGPALLASVSEAPEPVEQPKPKLPPRKRTTPVADAQGSLF
jgi:putative SOS response-associated peptidase YedK